MNPNTTAYMDTVNDLLLKAQDFSNLACKLSGAKLPPIYVVTAVDTSDSADGKARVLGAFKSEADARAYVRNDIEAYLDDLIEMHSALECDFDAMFARTTDGTYGCEWNIEAIELQ